MPDNTNKTELTLDFEPEKPESGDKSDVERSSVEARTKLNLERERDITTRAIARALNYPADLHLPRIESTYRAPKTTAKDLKKAAETKSPFDDLRIYTRAFFSSDNKSDMEGLGRVVRGIEKLDSAQLGAVIREVAAGQNKNLSSPDKINMSMMRATAEFALQNRGYAYDTSSSVSRDSASSAHEKATAKNQHRILHGETIEKIMRKMGGEPALALWRQVVQQLRVGPLAHGGALPGGGYLRFDEKGYPIYIATDASEPTPEVPQFQKQQTPSVAPSSVRTGSEAPAKNEKERAIDFLMERLKPGDILLVNARPRKKSFVTRGFHVLGRIAQDTEDSDGTPFHAIHPIVYLGDGKGAHVHSADKGGKTFDLRDRLRTTYNAVTVARIGDTAQAEKFAKEAEKVVLGITKYNYSEFYHRGVEFVKRNSGGNYTPTGKSDPKVNSAICLDVVSLAAKAAGIKDLENVRSATDIVKALDVPYSIDVDLPLGYRAQ